jgi:uncharacterized protein (TIGR02271 family)
MIEDTRDRRIIPVTQEALSIERRTVETDHVRVSTVVEEKDVEVVTQLARQELIVERRKVEREVTAAPAPVEHGDTIVISIVEERAIIEKRLFVVEELVIRRIGHVEDVHIPATLKTMRAVVEQDSDPSS